MAFAAANRLIPVRHRVPLSLEAFAQLAAKAEPLFMLPGFRFLVAAVVLCLSMLVFGFGATALLRSAREEFANLPVRRTAPQTVFASQQLAEAPPTLSMLRVEAPEIRAEPAALPQDSPAPSAPEPEKQASLSLGAPTPEIAPVAEPAPSEPAKVETTAPVETPYVAVVTPSPAAAEVRAEEPATVAAIAPPPAPDQPASTLTETDAQIVVATLGETQINIGPVPLPKAKPVATPAKKKARVKEKPAKRRRLEARAEQAAPAAAPAPADTFGWQQPR